MNIFRLSADMSHLIAIFILLIKVIRCSYLIFNENVFTDMAD